MARYFSSQNCLFARGTCTHMQYIVSWTHPTQHQKQPLNRFSGFCRAHDHRRPTDNSIPSATVCRIYVCRTAMLMQPNNNNNNSSSSRGSNNNTNIQLGIVLANILRLRYVAIAMQPVHRLQICPIVHN